MLTGLAAERIQRGTQQGCADRLHIRRPPHTLRPRARGKHTRSPPGVSDDFLTCKSGVVPRRSRRELRQAWGQLRLAGITIRTSRRNTTGSDLLGRRYAAFERRVVPEDQHENSGEEREE